MFFHDTDKKTSRKSLLLGIDFVTLHPILRKKENGEWTEQDLTTPNRLLLGVKH